MPRRIPIAAAKRFARENGLNQVVVIAWDGECRHVVTYGAPLEDSAQAAESGNALKRYLGWPREELQAQSSRVRRAIANATKAKDEEIAKLRRCLGVAEETMHAISAALTRTLTAVGQREADELVAGVEKFESMAKEAR